MIAKMKNICQIIKNRNSVEMQLKYNEKNSKFKNQNKA